MNTPRSRFAAILEWLQEQRESLRRQRRADPQRFAWLGSLGVIVAGLVAYLLLAEKPWNAGTLRAMVQGHDLAVDDYLLIWSWLAALANALLLSAAIACHRRWLRTDPAPVCDELAPPARRPSRVFVLLVAGAVFAGSLLAFPRLDHSLWTDEIFSVRRVIDGYWRKGDDGALEFRNADWTHTFWYYRNPNNHIPFIVLSRLSLTAWQHTHPQQGGIRFGETALRLPAFAAGAGSIAAGSWLLWRAGFPAAGVLLAWLLAIHPWHVRYASEARGYSLMLFALSTQLAVLLAVLHRGSWPRWIAYSLCQTLLLWLYPLLGVPAVVLNLAALAALFQLHGRGALENGQALRWVVANLVCVLLLVQLFAPLVPQVLHYVGTQHDQPGAVGLMFLRNVASHLYLGMPWRVSRVPDHPYVQLFDAELGGAPALLMAGSWLALLGVALGVARLWRCGGVRRTTALLLLIPGPLVWLLAWLSGVFLWEWYLLFMLPMWGALLALGFSWPLAARGRLAKGAAALGLAVLFTSFAVASERARDAQRRYPIQPRRESVALTRPDLDPLAPSQSRVLTASFHVDPSLYDPNVHITQTPDELRTLMARADRESLPLFVNVGWLRGAVKRAPGMKELVEQEEFFEQVAVLPGLKPRFTRHVYRYRGADTSAE